MLQMVSEPDTGLCASEEVIPRRGIDMKRCVSKDVGPQMGRFGRGPTSIGERRE